MSRTRFIFLLSLVIGSAGISIWVVYLAARANALDGSLFRPLLPLLLLGSLGIRLLLNGRKE